MTDSNEQTNEGQPEFIIHNVYLKDVSFESPNAPAIFNDQQKPDIKMNLGVNTTAMEEDMFEVVLSITVQAKMGEDKTAFLVELHQAGAFTLRGLDENAMGHTLGVYIPNLLFPYAREAVANLVMKGGFPQLLLEPVNFEALYAQHLQQQAQG